MTYISVRLRQLAMCLALGALLAIDATSKAPAAQASAQPEKVKKTETGLASYYSRRFEGKETASGKTFRNEELVAAHPTHPFGTVVRVTNLENQTSVVVRISDRGASATNRRKGVVIDLSQAAATRLKMKKDGRVRVRVQVLEWGGDDHKPTDVGKK